MNIISIISILLAIIFIVVDQLIKHWAASELMKVGTMDFIKFGDLEILALTYVQNDGAAFSSFSGAKWFLIGLTSIMIIALIIYVVKDKTRHPFMMISAASVISGGIGNLIDRVRMGYVIDYLDVKLFNFAVFNFADICVVVGAICLVIYILFIEKKETGSNGTIDLSGN